MARTKEFNPEKSLDAAVEVFWEQGYEHTSLDALMDKMGIARQSLYDTFGDKRALYLKALERRHSPVCLDLHACTLFWRHCACLPASMVYRGQSTLYLRENSRADIHEAAPRGAGAAGYLLGS